MVEIEKVNYEKEIETIQKTGLLYNIQKEVQKKPYVKFNIWYFRIFMMSMYIFGIIVGLRINK